MTPVDSRTGKYSKEAVHQSLRNRSKDKGITHCATPFPNTYDCQQEPSLVDIGRRERTTRW